MLMDDVLLYRNNNKHLIQLNNMSIESVALKRSVCVCVSLLWPKAMLIVRELWTNTVSSVSFRVYVFLSSLDFQSSEH